MVRWTDGRVKPSWRGPGLLDRWKGQTRLAGGLARWIDGKVKTKLADGMLRWIGGKGSDSPLPGFGWWSGALTPAGSREFKGRPRDDKTIRSGPA
jgi:hypothetical protein